MKTKIFILSFILSLSFQLIFPQEKDTLVNFYLNKGIEELSKNNPETAKDYFKSSIREKDNAPAEYELAKIFRSQKSNSSLNLSREHIKAAVKLEPGNIEYRLFYASLSIELFNTSKFETFAWNDAFKQYCKVVEIDSTNTIALKGLWQIKMKDFSEQHFIGNRDNSPNNTAYGAVDPLQDLNNPDINITGRTMAKQIYDLYSEPVIKSESFAQEDFKLAEKALLTSVKFQPSFPDSYYDIGILYEENQNYDKGIYYMKKYISLKPDDEKGHIYLGLLYYEVSKLDSSYNEYENAFNLMSSVMRADYQFNSVKILLEPFLGDKMKSYSDDILEQIIKVFWEARNPFYLSEYNVRLLEHYSRVAYSNLYFGNHDNNIPGWNTDRGTIMLRYGFPSSRVQLAGSSRSYFDGNTKNNISTEIWTYADKTFAFTDEFRNGDYRLAQRGRSQYWDDSQGFAEDLKKTMPEEYHPKFEGPVFNIPYNIAEFKNNNRQDLTDLYVNYGIKINKDSVNNTASNIKHKAGLFFFDNNFTKLAEVEATVSSLKSANMITVSDTDNYMVNSISFSTKPDSGKLSFEAFNNSNKGAASYHQHYKITKFNNNNLDISDLLLASKVSDNIKEPGTIKRKQISILPNPLNTFVSATRPYIYYELYNLKSNPNGHTNFTQEIVLQNALLKEEGISLGKIVGSIIKFVSKGNSEYNVGISSNYETEENNMQMYFQIDMTGYKPADYILTVNIKDNISGKEISKSTTIKWK